jgi:quinol-cytochrome oxidoreductase complex cytochrome b subunit
MVDEAVLDRLVAIRRVLAWTVVAFVVVLAVTGAYLVVDYRPKPVQAWGPGIGEADGGPTFAGLVRTAHRWTALIAVLPSLALAAVAFAEAMARWRGPRRRRTGSVAGPAIAVTVIVAVASGFLLPWDQLALWSVTVGRNDAGYRWLLDDEVRFVLQHGAEVSVASMRTAFVVHVLVVSAVLVASLGALVRRR